MAVDEVEVGRSFDCPPNSVASSVVPYAERVPEGIDFNAARVPKLMLCQGVQNECLHYAGCQVDSRSKQGKLEAV